jgi:hypothetical protein
VVASSGDALRLRWLLNALDEQTLPRASWEALVAVPPTCPDVAALLAEHPLGQAGVLRRVDAGTTTNLVERLDLGWRATRADLVVFGDEYDRPRADWLARFLDGARDAPGAVLEGRVEPDPTESNLMRSPLAYTRASNPPAALTPTTNVAYPRTALAAVDGFADRRAIDPSLAGADLALRATAAGHDLVPVRDALAWAAVRPFAVRPRLARALRGRHLPSLLERHPRLSGRELGDPAQGGLARLVFRAALGWGAMSRRATVGSQDAP